MKTTSRPRGRPRGPEKKKITIQLPPDIIRRLHATARAAGVPICLVAERVLDRALPEATAKEVNEEKG